MKMVDLRCCHKVWQFRTSNIFPAVKQGLMLAYDNGTCAYLNQLVVQNLLVLSVSHMSEEQLFYHPQDDNFKPMLKRTIFNCASWLHCLFSGEWTSEFSEAKTYPMAPISPLNLPKKKKIIVASIVYGLHREKHLVLNSHSTDRVIW
jgi:hypothetical protein